MTDLLNVHCRLRQTWHPGAFETTSTMPGLLLDEVLPRPDYANQQNANYAVIPARRPFKILEMCTNPRILRVPATERAVLAWLTTLPHARNISARSCPGISLSTTMHQRGPPEIGDLHADLIFISYRHQLYKFLAIRLNYDRDPPETDSRTHRDGRLYGRTGRQTLRPPYRRRR